MATTSPKDKRGNEVRIQTKESDFVPFACHYDPYTILNKNGELLQTIKIVGFTAENVIHDKKEKITLRRAVRKAIMDSFDGDEYAIWLHTVRRKKSLSAGGEYPDSFSRYVNNAWRKRHDWDHKYVNELYITIIIEGKSFAIKNHKDFARSLFFKPLKKYLNAHIAEAHMKLEGAVKKMLQSLSTFGARRLGIFEHKGVFYSENMKFLSKIINLDEFNYPVKEIDLSKYLPVNQVSFGFNALEVKSNDKRQFGGIISIKEYHEVSSKAIDSFLQLPFEFIITESIDFINQAEAMESFEYQRYLISLSQDKAFAQYSGLDDIAKTTTGKPTDFGEHQITIMVLEDSLKLLEKEIHKIQDALSHIGILTVREDVMMEDCFWAQLPGNFSFIRRHSPINTARVGGFASLYNFPAGKLVGNHWGNAITIFYTASGTPYFFNFHHHNVGHSFIIGPFGAGKTVLMNFMISEARKYDNRIFFFDQNRNSEIFLKALNGKYYSFEPSESLSTVMPKMNPLLMEDTEENKVFVKAWLQYMLMPEKDQLSETEKERLTEVVKLIFAMPPEERKIAAVASLFEKMEMPRLMQEMRHWWGEGKYAHIFDHDEDNLAIGHISGFDMTYLVRERQPLGAVLSYLMHRIKISLDGKPAMMVLDEAWTLVDNYIFAPHISKWLDDLTKLNTMVIFATESVDDASKSRITADITKKISTRIFLPNSNAGSAYRTVFGLTDQEFEMLNLMNKQKRAFLLKHAGDAVIAELNLEGMNEIIAVLSATPENIILMDNMMKEIGSPTEKWLPSFIFKKKGEKK